MADWTISVESREVIDLVIRLVLLALTAWVLITFVSVRKRRRKDALVMALIWWMATTEGSLAWYVVATFFTPPTEMWLRDHSWLIQTPRLVATIYLVKVIHDPPS